MNPSPKQVFDGFFLSPEVLLRGLGSVCDLPAGRLPMFSGNLNSAGLVFFFYLIQLKRNIKSKGRIGGVGTDILMLLTAMNVNISPPLLSQNLDVSLCLEQWNRQYFMTKC